MPVLGLPKKFEVYHRLEAFRKETQREGDQIAKTPRQQGLQHFVPPKGSQHWEAKERRHRLPKEEVATSAEVFGAKPNTEGGEKSGEGTKDFHGS